MSEWLEPFIAARIKSKNIRANTQENYRQHASAFLFVIGDIAVADVSVEHAEQFRDTLLRLPTHRNKRLAYIGLSADVLVDLEVPENERPPGRTVSEHLTSMSTIFGWLKKHRRVVPENPFEEVATPHESKSYSEFEPEDLTAIFSSDLYVPGSKYATAAATTAGHWWYLLTALFTGARPSELLQAGLEDASEVGGILCISIVDDPKSGKMVKTLAGRRVIPIHPTLLRLGFADYLQALRDEGASRVFEGIRKGKRKAGDQVGKWFNGRYRATRFPEFKAQSKVLYSFRHTHITAALNADVEIRTLQQWVGHERKQLGQTKSYDKGQKPPQVFEAISRVSWDCEAIDALQQDWRSMKLFRESRELTKHGASQ